MHQVWFILNVLQFILCLKKPLSKLREKGYRGNFSFAIKVSRLQKLLVPFSNIKLYTNLQASFHKSFLSPKHLGRENAFMTRDGEKRLYLKIIDQLEKASFVYIEGKKKGCHLQWVTAGFFLCLADIFIYCFCHSFWNPALILVSYFLGLTSYFL